METHTRSNGSVYHTKWTKTDLYCVACGEQWVWEDDCDDYYNGTTFECGVCGAEFNHPLGAGMTNPVLAR